MFSQYRHFALALAATSSITLGLPAWSQDPATEQVLAEVGAAGKAVGSTGQGVVRPDFTDIVANEKYTPWVPNDADLPSPGLSSTKAFSISPRGTALVLDGTRIREFSSKGKELKEATDNGFPVGCLDLVFEVPPKGNTTTDTLSECTAFTALNDGSLRIAGKSRGNGFVIVAWRQGKVPKLTATGTPPTITDMAADEFVYENNPERPGTYVAVGDKKKVLRFPIADPWDVNQKYNSEQVFDTVATLNGKTIDSVTPFGPDRIVVILNTGELWSITPGASPESIVGATDLPLVLPVPDSATCSVRGSKDPRKFSVRADPVGGLLYGGSPWCNSIALLEPIVSPSGRFALGEADLEDVDAPLFDLEDFSVEALDWQIGQGGDFTECSATSTEKFTPPADACQFGKTQNQAVSWGVRTVGADTSYRMFEFVNLVDCRWTPETADNDACPVVCPAENSPLKECALDLVPLMIEAGGNAFRAAAFPDTTEDADLPKMLIPAYMRGEETYPDCASDGSCLSGSNGVVARVNGYKFHTFFAVTEALFTGTFFVDYKLDEFRDTTGTVIYPGHPETDQNDACLYFDGPTPLEELKESTNLMVYNDDKDFGSVYAGKDAATWDDGVEKRFGVIGNSFCNAGATRAKWSANTLGLEYHSTDPYLYVDEGLRMIEELEKARTELLGCYPSQRYDKSLSLLSTADCATIQNRLELVSENYDKCIGSLTRPLNGSSENNCNALSVQLGQLRGAVEAPGIWAEPDPANPAKFNPNYEGEFKARLDTLEFFINNYVINSAPPGGFSPRP